MPKEGGPKRPSRDYLAIFFLTALTVEEVFFLRVFVAAVTLFTTFLATFFSTLVAFFTAFFTAFCTVFLTVFFPNMSPPHAICFSRMPRHLSECYQVYHGMSIPAARANLFALLKVLEELSYLDTQIDTLNIIHTLIGVYFLEMSCKFVLTFCQRDNVCIFLPAEVKAERYPPPLDFGIHLRYLVFQTFIRVCHRSSFIRPVSGAGSNAPYGLFLHLHRPFATDEVGGLGAATGRVDCNGEAADPAGVPAAFLNPSRFLCGPLYRGLL
jgi:hypothetical protein